MAVFQKKSDKKSSTPSAADFETSDIVSAVFETSPECIKVVARDGGLVKMNPAGLAMIEADSWESVAGAATLDLIAPEH